MLDWQHDILPVLRSTYDLMDEQQDDFVQGDELMASLVTEDRNFTQIDLGGYARVDLTGGGIAFVRPTEKGLQTTRGWPVPGHGDVEALLRLLDQRIAAPGTSDEERTRLQRLRDAAGGVSQSVLSSLLSAWLSQVSGINQ